jgi:hypothetical protein
MATKADTNGHKNETGAANKDALTVAQHNAIDLLIHGKTDGDTALAVGVTRQTVNEWRNHNPVFIAELNARRQEIYGACGERLRALVPKTIDALEKTFEYGDPKERITAAVHILKAAGLYGTLSAPDGPTDAAEVEVERKLIEAETNHKNITRRGGGFKSQLDRLLAESEFSE